MVTFHVVSLFPQALDSYIHESIIKRAQQDKKIKIAFYNPRDFTPVPKQSLVRGKLQKKNTRIDAKPYGGGPGMVIQAEPVIKAIEKAVGRKKDVLIVFFEPEAQQFDTNFAKQAARTYKHIVFVCGRYEGIDARVKEVFDVETVSIGPYVLTGGELPALVMMDSIARQVPGVLGEYSSLEEERIASHDVYTRPEVLVHKKKTYTVPDVLLSGNHKQIDEWREKR